MIHSVKNQVYKDSLIKKFVGLIPRRTKPIESLLVFIRRQVSDVEHGANMFRDQIAVAGGQQIPRADTIWLTSRHEAAGLFPLLHVPLAFWTDINRNLKPSFWFIWPYYLRKFHLYHRLLKKVTKRLDEISIGTMLVNKPPERLTLYQAVRNKIVLITVMNVFRVVYLVTYLKRC